MKKYFASPDYLARPEQCFVDLMASRPSGVAPVRASGSVWAGSAL